MSNLNVTPEKLQKISKRIHKTILERGGSCKISDVHEGLAQALGAKNYNGLQASTKPPTSGDQSPLKLTPVFKQAEIQQFYDTALKSNPWWCGPTKSISLKILEVLDKLGDCPSVRIDKDETELSMRKNMYDFLKKIPLYKHALNVASIMIEDAKDPFEFAKALISGLGHDLGKIPEFCDVLYSFDSHPHLSNVVLRDIPGFAGTTMGDEIENAIRNHHSSGEGGRLGARLRVADLTARREELYKVSSERALSLGSGETATIIETAISRKVPR